MKALKHIITLILITISICGFQSDWTKIDKKEYSLEHPSNWKPLNVTLPNTELRLSPPSKKGEDDKFQTSMSLVTKDLKGKNIDLKKFVETTKVQIPFLLENGTIVESKPFGTGHMFVYKGKYGDYNVKYKQAIWVKNEKAFILTFGTDESDFSTYITTIDKILNSFKLKM